MQNSLMSETERGFWKENGYLILKGVLSSAEVASLKEGVDDMYANHLENQRAVSLARAEDDTAREDLHAYNVIEDNNLFLHMIDHPAMFPVVLELMGHNIILTQSQAIVRVKNRKRTNLLHTDGGEAMQRIRVTSESLPLQIKIQYFLTDVFETNAGNFQVVPRSHRLLNHKTANLKVVQLCVERGDALIFPHSVWHGFAPNLTDNPRISLCFAYSQQFMRPFDFSNVSLALLNRCNARQKRLLGDVGDWRVGSYFYSPTDQKKVMTQ